MSMLHEKSPCCQGKIRRFGQRRRQCTICLKTWRSWKRKRGRNQVRINQGIIPKYLDNEFGSLRKQVKKRRLKLSTLYTRVRKSRNVFNDSEKWLTVPLGDLVAIADALVQPINGKYYTIYFILLKSPQENRAIITLPYIVKGTEKPAGWRKAFGSLPKRQQKKIVALVSDGSTGLILLAQHQGWIHQRCQFHLWSRINHYLSFGPLTRHKQEALLIKKSVDIILNSKNETKVLKTVDNLTKIKRGLSSTYLKRVISGFLRNYQEYRNYLYYPDLNLPTTSNAVESLISSLREFQHRARGFRSKKSLMAWIIANLKHKKMVVCNGKYQPN